MNRNTNLKSHRLLRFDRQNVLGKGGLILEFLYLKKGLCKNGCKKNSKLKNNCVIFYLDIVRKRKI